MRLTQTQGIWRRSLNATSLVQILSIWTCRSLLCCSRSNTLLIRLRSQASLTSFVCFSSLLHRLLATNPFTTTYHLALAILHVKLIHFVIKCCSAYWTTFKYSQLLLIQNLGVCKTLISSRRPKLR